MARKTPPSQTKGYVSLHTHSEYSPLDGLASVQGLVMAAAKDGNPAIAITDHDSLGGQWKLAKIAKSAGIKAIHGVEAYLAFDDRFKKIGGEVDPDDEDTEDVEESAETDAPKGRLAAKKAKVKVKKYMHLTLIAYSRQGWHNLVRIVNASQDSIWSKPRIDVPLLKEYSEGILVLTGCLGGPLAYHLNRAVLSEARGDFAQGEKMRAKAQDYVDDLIDAVGRKNVYVEVMDHSIPAQMRVAKELRGIAKTNDLKLVATNDAHYVTADQAEAHAAWLCVGSKSQLDNPKFSFNGEGHHMRSEAEMRALFGGKKWWNKAVDNTVKIAKRVADDVMPPTQTRLPNFTLPSGYDSPAKYLKHLTRRGAVQRWSGLSTDEFKALDAAELKTQYKSLSVEIRDRLDFELSVIEKQGFPDYFLIVADVIAWARSQDILVGPGRGSAAGSAVSFALEIVDVDPIKHGLLFERFLDLERAGLPDIDVDFEKRKRHLVLAYVANKYGYDHVAQLGTFGIARTKAAIKDAGRVMGQSTVANDISPAVPVHGGKPSKFADLDNITDPKNTTFWDKVNSEKNSPFAQEIVDLARQFEGITKQPGVHACGVVIGDEPLTGLVPTRWNSSKDNKETSVRVTVWDGKDIEGYGLVKMDFLAIKTLDVIGITMENIAKVSGEQLTLLDMDPDAVLHPDRDAKVWELIQSGQTAGIFQLESSGMQKLATNVVPENIDDLSALVALYRPGPLGAGMEVRYADRKNGREGVTYSYITPHKAEQDVIARVLDPTLGVIIYQEQLMQLGEEVAGFDPAGKNRLRQAVSKKIKEEVDAVGQLWRDGGVEESVLKDGRIKPAFTPETLHKLWETFDASAEYLFNKSHSAAYAKVAYYTAFLKASWPAEFGAARLEAEENKSNRQTHLRELRSEGIEVFAPHVNRGFASTSSDGVSVTLGMSEVAEVGFEVAQAIVDERQRGPFVSLTDFMTRVHTPDGKRISNTVITALIEAGALDEFGPRLAMIKTMHAGRTAANVATDLPSLTNEWGTLERSLRERERLGIIVSEHPMYTLRDQLRNWNPWRDDAAFERALTPLHKMPDLIDPNGGSNQQVPARSLAIIAAIGLRDYKGGQMATMHLESRLATVEAVMFDRDLRSYLNSHDGQLPQVGDLVCVTGKVSVREWEMEKTSEDGEVIIEVQRKTSVMVSSIRAVDVDSGGENALVLEHTPAPAILDFNALPLVNVPVDLESQCKTIHREIATKAKKEAKAAQEREAALALTNTSSGKEDTPETNEPEPDQSPALEPTPDPEVRDTAKDSSETNETDPEPDPDPPTQEVQTEEAPMVDVATEEPVKLDDLVDFDEVVPPVLVPTGAQLAVVTDFATHAVARKKKKAIAAGRNTGGVSVVFTPLRRPRGSRLSGNSLPAELVDETFTRHIDAAAAFHLSEPVDLADGVYLVGDRGRTGRYALLNLSYGYVDTSTISKLRKALFGPAITQRMGEDSPRFTFLTSADIKTIIKEHRKESKRSRAV